MIPKVVFHFVMLFQLLPSASEGWGKVMFSLCLSVHTWGGTLVPGSFPGHWSQVLSGGTPSLARGYPSPDGQVRMGYPLPGLGYHPPWSGLGYPPPPPDRTAERERYASCGQGGGLYCLILICISTHCLESDCTPVDYAR